jgi:hypothetical protein
MLHPPVLWTIPDGELTCYGGTNHEFLTEVMGVRQVSRRVLKAGNLWRGKREKWGLPLWLSQVDLIDVWLCLALNWSLNHHPRQSVV